MTFYIYSLLIPIRAFPSEGRITWVLRYFNISKGSYAYCTTSTSRYVHVRTIHLTSQTTRQARFPMQNVIPHTGRDAPLEESSEILVSSWEGPLMRLVGLRIG
jgi:hypothetical protein